MTKVGEKKMRKLIPFLLLLNLRSDFQNTLQWNSETEYENHSVWLRYDFW